MCLSHYLSVCLSLCLSVSLSICMSVYLPGGMIVVHQSSMVNGQRSLFFVWLSTILCLAFPGFFDLSLLGFRPCPRPLPCSGPPVIDDDRLVLAYQTLDVESKGSLDRVSVRRALGKCPHQHLTLTLTTKCAEP